MRKILKIAGVVCAALLLLCAAAAGWFWWQLETSLPIYDGELTLEGLTAPVTVERDALGVVTIRSENALDEVRATGFIHAQERFFQMDLDRRRAAGEMSELLGAVTVAGDEQARRYLRRERLERGLAAMTSEEREFLEAYADGVNAGLAALGAKPFEYVLLRADPEPWTVVDSMLAATREPGIGGKRDEFLARGVLPHEFADFLYPSVTEWEAPVTGEPGPPATIPTADVYDLRGGSVPQAAVVAPSLPCQAQTTGPSRGPTPRPDARWSRTIRTVLCWSRQTFSACRWSAAAVA